MQEFREFKTPLWRQPLVVVAAAAALMVVGGIGWTIYSAEELDEQLDRRASVANRSESAAELRPSDSADRAEEGETQSDAGAAAAPNAEAALPADREPPAAAATSPLAAKPASDSPASWAAGAVLAFDCESASRIDRQGVLQLRDLSGRENNAQVTSGAWVEGKVGEAIEFGGAEGFLECADADSLNPTAAFSIALWAKAKAWGLRSLVSKDDWEAGGARGYVLRQLGDDRFDFTIGAGGWQTAPSGGGMQTGRWYHVAGVFDGKTIRLYVDGEERGSTPCAAAIEPSHYKLRVGGCQYSPESRFLGAVDEVAVWSRALSPAEIQDLYEYSNAGRSYCKAIGTVRPPLFASHKSADSPTVAEQGPKSPSAAAPAGATTAPPPSIPSAELVKPASPDWLKLDEHGEPCQVTLADGTVLKLDTYGDEYEGYEFRPPMPAEKAEILVDYKRMHRDGLYGGGIQLDLKHKKMYWGESPGGYNASSILRANLDGSRMEVIVDRHPLQPGFSALDPKGGKIYWVNIGLRDGSGRSVERANLDGSNREVIIPHAPGAGAIAIDAVARKLYRFDFQNLLRSELDGSDEVRIAVETFAAPIYTLLVDHESQRIYWDLNNWMIHGCGFDGGAIENVVNLGEFAAKFRRVALDSKSKKIYWANESYDGYIRRANINGSQIETIVVGIHNPNGLDVDAERQQIYWMESFADEGGAQQVRVRRAKLPPIAKPKKLPAPPLVRRLDPVKQSAGSELTLTGKHFKHAKEVLFVDDGEGESEIAKFEERSDSELSIVVPRMSKRCRHPQIVVRTPGGLTAVLSRSARMAHRESLDRYHPDDQFAWLAPTDAQISIDRGVVLALGRSLLSPLAYGKSTFFLKNHAVMGFRRTPDNLVYFEPFALINDFDRPTDGSRMVPVPAIRPSFVEAPLEYQAEE